MGQGAREGDVLREEAVAVVLVASHVVDELHASHDVRQRLETRLPRVH